MTLNPELVAAVDELENGCAEPRVLTWPVPGNASAFLPFDRFSDWCAFFDHIKLHPAVPAVVIARFERARKLHLFAWFDGDLIKAGELVALSALEQALLDCYGGKLKQKKGNPSLSDLLKHMPGADNLTDDKLPFIKRVGGTVISRLDGTAKPTLAEIRNSLAHGSPFQNLPWPGLLELIRDLIQYAYRTKIADGA